MAIKPFLIQNLSLIALLVLEIWRHKISLRRRERVMKFGYLPPENGFNFKKMSFYVQNRSSRPKIDPPCQFQQFLSIGKIFHFQNFWDVLMRKEQQHPPDWPILKVCPAFILTLSGLWAPGLIGLIWMQDILSAVINTIKTNNNCFKALGTNAAVHCSWFSRLAKNNSKY